jgi:hypothetical protein
MGGLKSLFIIPCGIGSSRLFGGAKACESQWYDNKVVFTSIFLYLFHFHYSEEYLYKSTIDHVNVHREVQRIIYEELV